MLNDFVLFSGRIKIIVLTCVLLCSLFEPVSNLHNKLRLDEMGTKTKLSDFRLGYIEAIWQDAGIKGAQSGRVHSRKPVSAISDTRVNYQPLSGKNKLWKDWQR